MKRCSCESPSNVTHYENTLATNRTVTKATSGNSLHKQICARDEGNDVAPWENSARSRNGVFLAQSFARARHGAARIQLFESLYLMNIGCLFLDLVHLPRSR